MCNQVSIIIPVYNTDNYLRSSLDSILKQEYADWECILVDDGSTDGSGQICEEYAKKDSRFKVIHQENQGASQARNVGIELSSGNWICFVDSDDTLSPDAISVLFHQVVKFDSDVCICKLITSIPDTNTAHILSVQEKEQLIWSCLAFRTSRYNDDGYIVDGPCAKIFRASIIREYKLRFTKGLKRSEDAIFDAYFYQYANRVILFDRSVYSYIYNVDSITHKFDKHFPETLSMVLLEEKRFVNHFGICYDSVCVRAFVGMYQLINEWADKQIPIWQHAYYLRRYLCSEIVHECLNNLTDDLVAENFNGRSQTYKLFLAQNKCALAILLWIKFRHH